MRIKISISKKIMGMVLLPIICICMLVGVISANTLDETITSEIEKELHFSAYNFKNDYELLNESDFVNLISKFKVENGVDVTIFANEIRLLSTVPNAVGTEISRDVLLHIQDGNNYFTTDANVNGEDYFGYYIPIMENNQYVGASFTGIPKADAQQIIRNGVMKMMGFVIVCGVVAVVVALILVNGIVRSIIGLENTISTLLNNDLVTKHNKHEFEHDEIEEIGNKTVDFAEHLNKIITRIKEVSTDLKEVATNLKANAEFTNDTCNQISQAIENVASGAVSQAEDTTNAAQNMSDMSEELSNIRSNVNELDNIANFMNTTKDNTIGTLNVLQNVNETIVEKMEITNNTVHSTAESVEQIKKAVAIIKDIASQTNLLSLNASIEAAHAGENGKGFAVVAEEIGKLATQSSESSNEIEEILRELVKNYNDIISNVNVMSQNIDVQNEKLHDTRQAFTILEDNIGETVKEIVAINRMIHKLDTDITKMVDTISNLSAISEENSASAEETMASIQELNATINQVYEKSQIVDSSADELVDEVNVFITE